MTAQVQAGKLRALAISGAKSLDLLPGVPPIEEFIPTWNPPQFYNFVSAPAGTPVAVQEKIGAALKQVLADPKVASCCATTTTNRGSRLPLNYAHD